MPPFLDTNILIYARSNEDKAPVAKGVLARPFHISVQVLNEFVVVLRRKLMFEWEQVETAVGDIVEVAGSIVPVSLDGHIHALRLAERYRLQFYDATIVAAALRTGCDVLMSEDMHNGLVIEDRLTIRNPFRAA